MNIKKLLVISAMVCLTACGGGTSVSELPPNLSGPSYSGTITNADGTATRNIQFNLIQNPDNSLSGVVSIEDRGTADDCLASGGAVDSATSSLNGFSAIISVTLFSSNTATTSSDDNDSNNSSNSSAQGSVVFNVNADDNQLTGNYSVTGVTVCRGNDRSGSVTASR